MPFSHFFASCYCCVAWFFDGPAKTPLPPTCAPQQVRRAASHQRTAPVDAAMLALSLVPGGTALLQQQLRPATGQPAIARTQVPPGQPGRRRRMLTALGAAKSDHARAGLGQQARSRPSSLAACRRSHEVLAGLADPRCGLHRPICYLVNRSRRMPRAASVLRRFHFLPRGAARRRATRSPQRPRHNSWMSFSTASLRTQVAGASTAAVCCAAPMNIEDSVLLLPASAQQRSAARSAPRSVKLKNQVPAVKVGMSPPPAFRSGADLPRRAVELQERRAVLRNFWCPIPATLAALAAGPAAARPSWCRPAATAHFLSSCTGTAAAPAAHHRFASRHGRSHRRRETCLRSAERRLLFRGARSSSSSCCRPTASPPHGRSGTPPRSPPTWAPPSQ